MQTAPDARRERRGGAGGLETPHADLRYVAGSSQSTSTPVCRCSSTSTSALGRHPRFGDPSGHSYSCVDRPSLYTASLSGAGSQAVSASCSVRPLEARRPRPDSRSIGWSSDCQRARARVPAVGSEVGHARSTAAVDRVALTGRTKHWARSLAGTLRHAAVSALSACA